ncbi:MAG: hypothetical protein JEZ06_17245 [Anaerolineaceae bacterium]|nr:hypothetical protein [Anaerolineaceae bacterium]
MKTKIISIMEKTVQLLLLLSMIFGQWAPISAAAMSEKTLIPDVDPRVQTMLNNMTPEEKVGQLFIVTFEGSQIDSESRIYDLIVNRHIGGVILKAENNNIPDKEAVLEELTSLTKNIQTIEFEDSLKESLPTYTTEAVFHQFIPLFIGISQEGDTYPTDEILNGLTTLPSLLSIGATWDTELAKEAGSVLGYELRALGINLLIGPSLDIFDAYYSIDGEDLKVSTFGENSFWVGEMGRSYIEGVHEGSENQIAVFPKLFPGIGSSDRSLDEEVPIVQKSLQQLKENELKPFFAVSNGLNNENQKADGFVVGHVRYPGIQGIIQSSTRPISSDAGALEQLMSLPGLREWREEAGILLSDNLGNAALRTFYDPLGQSFDARQVARDAFIAGNDLMFLDDFVATGDQDQYTTIGRTIDFFLQKYTEDPAFAQRVDLAVERILTKKMEIYKSFTLSSVIPTDEYLEFVGNSSDITFQVAQKGASLISPDAQTLSNVLPNAPRQSERIIFLTDVQTSSQCNTCIEQVTMPVDALQNAVLRFYGPSAGAQIFQFSLNSYSFSDLEKYIDSGLEEPNLDDSLRGADWVIVSLLDEDPKRPNSMAFQRLLSEYPELLRDKKVVVFSFSAPNYLDATDLSKISAYYAVYSKSPSFIDVAARILFKEFNPEQHIPVSVPGAGFDLSEELLPHADQIIALILDAERLEIDNPRNFEGITDTELPPFVPAFQVGDVIPLSTSVIYDKHFNPVPNGTEVKFIFSTEGETGAVEQIETTTIGGVAQASYRIQNSGALEISVISEPAMGSEKMILTIAEGQLAYITVIAPTPVYTETIEPTSSPVPNTPTPTLIPIDENDSAGPKTIWLVSIIIIWLIGLGAFLTGRLSISFRWGIRWGLLSASGGLVAYIYIASGFPGGMLLTKTMGAVGGYMGVIIGNLAGWFLGFIWRQRLVNVLRKSD